MTQLLKVVHLIQGLEIGGLEIMVVSLLENMDRSRFQPSVCCYDTPGSLAPQLTEQGIDVDLLARRPGVDLPYVWKLSRYLREREVRILHLHNPTAFFYGTLAGRLAGTDTIIYTEHGRDFSSSYKVRLSNRMLGKMVTQVVTVAEFGKGFLVEEEGINPGKIITIHNGIDATRFGHGDRPAGLLRALNLDDASRVIGIVARLDPIKNHAGLIKAMSRVVARVPGAVLLIIGDGPIRGELEEQVRALDLHEQVRFLGARSDVPELLRLLDLFVLCSHSEGLSLTLIEASAAARPIVATDVGGNNEVVEQGVNGLLVPADQPEALADAIIKLLGDPATSEAMGEAGRLKFEREFTLEAMVRKYEELYVSCLGR